MVRSTLLCLCLASAGCSLILDSGNIQRGEGGDVDAAIVDDLDGGAPDAFTPTECPSGYELTTVGCYQLSMADATAASAESSCASTEFMGVKAHLAVLESGNEVVAMRTAVGFGMTDDAIVGLFRPIGTTWRWINGSEFDDLAVPFEDDPDYEDYDANGRCAQLYAGVLLIKTACTSTNEFICEWDGAPPVVAVP